MTIDEFEIQVRTLMDTTLNQLQTVTLLLAQLEAQNSAAGDSVQRLSRLVETFIDEQRQNDEPA